MKIYLANDSKQTVGGGWTFLSNLKEGIKRISKNVEFVDNISKCDIFFISGATMVTRETVRLAQAAGKKIVLRIDNIPRNSRNRNTGTSRLKDFAQMADLVIYQSEWSREYVGGWLKKEGVVIYNGVDTKIFNKDGEKIPKEGNPQYLYSRYNRDESKRWDEAWYFYQMIHRKNSKAHLWIVGNFSNEQVEYSFDFYNNEKYTYWGVVEDKNTLSVILRSADVLLVPYFNDACSNTILEAMACGCQIEPLVSGLTGGTPGLFNIKDMSIERMASQYLYELQKIYEKNNRI
jgi:glycosyltransferase involved in cell wall biosynthesis